MRQFLHLRYLTDLSVIGNNRAEAEGTRMTLQKLPFGDGHYIVVSSEAILAALREEMARRGAPVNRRRLDQETQLAVAYRDYPDASRYADDWLMGFLATDKAQRIPTLIARAKEKWSTIAAADWEGLFKKDWEREDLIGLLRRRLDLPAEKAEQVAAAFEEGVPFRRLSPLSVQPARGLAPYQGEALLHQAPLVQGAISNAGTSALTSAEAQLGRMQGAMTLALSGCPDARWIELFLQSLAELPGAGGNQARTRFEMAPRSVVAIWTDRPVSGLRQYAFDAAGACPELGRITAEDLGPGDPFWVGGDLVRDVLSSEDQARLKEAGVHLYSNPVRLLHELGAAITAAQQAGT